MDPDRVAAVVAATAEVGPYFRLDIDRNCQGVPFADVSDADLMRYTHDVCRQLASHELRVGVSTWQFGLAARVWSVALGCWAISHVVPDLSGLVLIDDEDRPRLALPPAGGWAAEGAERAVAARVLRDQVLGALTPLHERLVDVTGIARGLLDGNAAAAVVGAVRSLQRFGQQRYGALRDLEPLLAAVLELDGLRQWLDPASPGSDRDWLSRRSCCLYYRAPAGSTCGGCPVRHPHRIGV